MQGLPAAIWSAAAVRAADAHAQREHGIAGYALMTRAGESALAALRAQWPMRRRLLVLCGRGSNGGDGYVLARFARAAGLEVTLAAPAGAPSGGDATRAAEEWRASGGAVVAFEPRLPAAADLVVDALLGTGLDRDVAEPYAAVIASVNACGRPVMALDVPSGLDADTGLPRGSAVRAALTVSFVGLKPGFYLGFGPEYVGRLVCDDLDVPAEAFVGERPVLRRIDEQDLRTALPRRARTAHKGAHGRVLLIGGGPGMPGALRLAGEAALRAGAGLVTLATRPEHAAVLAATRPELICVGTPDAAALAPLLAHVDVVAIGPGLGRDDWARALLDCACAGERPLVVDADALNLLALAPRRRDDWVLTPHPGEAARLLGCASEDVQRDRLGAARALVERYGGVAVLKGAGTLVAGGDWPVRVCDRGNPGMAAAGMGDVLTGVVAALAAQSPESAPPSGRLEPHDAAPRTVALARAAAAAVLVHATAGDLAARAGERGILASDVVAQLPACVNPAS